MFTRVILLMAVSQVVQGEKIYSLVPFNTANAATNKDFFQVVLQSDNDGYEFSSTDFKSILFAMSDCNLQEGSICHTNKVINWKLKNKITIIIDQNKHNMKVAGIGFSQKAPKKQRRRRRRSTKDRLVHVKIRIRRSGEVLFKNGGGSYRNKTFTSLNNNNSTGGRNTSGNGYYKRCLVNGVWVLCLGTWTPRPTTTCPTGFTCYGRVTGVKKKVVLSKKSSNQPGKNDSHKNQKIMRKRRSFRPALPALTVKQTLTHLTVGLKSILSLDNV
ncbi:uncharacterized protein LOC130647181 [Hydractinia symbiolongicarpus]|uniref:uncharacterized protein LOC130647181 n=1 Tax=Hydractinia symbiolongicarpus TaxID=13093 RepID=UPI00254F10B6|nr:uncharacterized protein LOC130647181 [Hydractinia symbiolongicarpus]